MTDREPPKITQDTPVGPDVDLDVVVVRNRDGVRITREYVENVVEHVHAEEKS